MGASAFAALRRDKAGGALTYWGMESGVWRPGSGRRIRAPWLRPPSSDYGATGAIPLRVGRLGRLRPGDRPGNGVWANQVAFAQVVAGQMRFEGRPALSSLVQPFDLKKYFGRKTAVIR